MDEDNTNLEADIGQLLMHLLASFNRERDATYASALQTDVARQALASAVALDFEGFRRALPRSFDGLEDVILRRAFPESHELRFLFQHSKFVECQIRHVFQHVEGSACCADKTRTVMRALVAFYAHDKPIAFDYAGQYTFHLPSKVLTTHDDIVAFFNAVHHLHCGFPKNYLDIMGRLENFND